MKKEELLEIKLKNLTYIVITGFVVLVLLIIGLYFSGNGSTNRSTDSNTNNASNTTTKEYDVSKMKSVTGDEAAKLFDKKGTHFLFIGRSTCGICVSLVPELNKTMSDLGITIHYAAMNTKTFRNDFENLFEHLDIETTIDKHDGTYGELLEKYGYTPMVFVIQDGKMVDGFVGYRDSSTISKLFKKYI